MCENVEKYTDSRLIYDEEKLNKLVRKPFFMSDMKLKNEAGELGAYEVISKKKKILNSKPHHVGVAILQYSKLLFLR